MESKDKIGLVLEGGGLRSLFSEGVFDVMLNHDVNFDGMIGVSAGASIGCNFKTKQVGRALRYSTNFAKDPNYIGIRSLIKTGDIVSKDYGYHTIPTELDIVDNETFKNNPMDFHLVCTDALTGKAVFKQLHDIDYEGLEWIRASSSMPIVSRPVIIEGRQLLDGGIANSIPLKYFQELGYKKNVVILTQPKGYKKKLTKLIPLFKVLCKDYPKITEAMARRHEMYNHQLDYISEQEKRGNTLVICPEDILPIGRLEMKPKKMKKVYNMGKKAGKENIERIKDFITHS